MAYLVYIDRGNEHVALVSACDWTFAELLRALLERHSAEYKIEIREWVSPGRETKAP